MQCNLWRHKKNTDGKTSKRDYYECPDEDLNFDEELLVREMGTLSPGGYNLREGGGSRGKLSKETKEKIGDAQRGENGYWYGKKQSEEHKQKNKEANIGRTHTKESIQKMVEATLGENNHASKRVYQYDVDGTFINSFGSSEEAARHLKGEGTSGSSIRACARGRRNYNTAHGFKWSYTLDVFM